MADISHINIPNGDGSVTYNLKDTSVPHSSLPAVSGGTDLSLVTTGEKAEWQDKGNYVIRGTNTTSNTFGHWTGNIPIPELYNGLIITYICSRNTIDVSFCDLELTFPDGSTSGRIEVVFDDGVNVSTEYQRERCVTLTYIDANHTSWGDPAWVVIAPSVLQWYVDNTEDGNYPLLFSEYAGRVTLNTTNCGAYKDTTFWYNPSTRNLHAEKVNGYILNNACAKDVDTTVTSGSSNLVTSGAVYTAIDNLPEPMVFKGTLGTGGTITTLPTASSSNEGYTYKVITAGTYASQSAKVGDVFVSNGSAWVLIPSGDTDSDTWRNIKVNGTELLGSAISTGAINFKSGANTTVSGSGNDITISSTDTNTTYSLTQDASDGHKITLTPSSGMAQTVTIPDNNTKYTFTGGTNSFKVSASDSTGIPQTVIITPSITNNVTGSGTSGYLAKFNSEHTITNAVALGSDTTKYLRNDGTWQVPSYPTVNNATLTIQKNGTNVQTFTANQGTNATANITVPTKTSELTNNSNFVTSNNATPYEAKLRWGGQNFSGSYGCIDAAMVSDLNANRFSFLKAAGITIEYTRDGGSTWIDYGATDAQKTGLFNPGANFVIGKADSTNKATANGTNYQLRVTINTASASIYTELKKIIIYCSTSGSAECKCQISGTLKPATTYTNITDPISISGWSGYNVIQVSFTAGNSFNGQYNNIRFLFTANGGDTTYNGLVITQILGFGGVGWTTPSTMAKTGHLYSYDASQNATFPAQVTASQFNGALNGNASTATKATQDESGNNIKATYGNSFSISDHTITLKNKNGGSLGTVTVPDNNTTYTLSTSGNNIVLTPSSGSANTITVPYATNAGKVNNLTVQTAVPTNAKFTDTTYTFANGTNGFTVTPSGGSAQTVTVTPSITNNVTGTGTSGYLTKFNGTHTITNGPQLGSSTTTYLNNAGSWATPPDTKNTAGSTNTSSKIFLIGATSQAANPQTYSNSGVSVKGTGELSAHTWSVKNSNDYSRAECYVDAEDGGRINVYDENGIGRIMLIGNSGLTLNDSTDTTTIFLDSDNSRVECDKMSYTNETVTFSKSSGSWSFAEGEYTRSGQVVQVVVQFKGGGSNVSVGSNAIAGTINGLPKPQRTIRLQGYYSGTILMGELTASGGFNVRILGAALNLSTSNKATLSGTYIVED